MKCCDLHAGLLRTPIVIKRQSRTADGAGGYESRGTDVVLNGFAKVENVSGTERMYSQRLDATVRAKVYIRYVSGILESDIIEFDGKDHNIRFIDNLQYQDAWIEIACDGGVPVVPVRQDAFILESGDYFLLEDGESRLILE